MEIENEKDLDNVQEVDSADVSMNDTKEDEKKKDVVAHETYMKLLKEKKNASERAQKLADEVKSLNEKISSFEKVKPNEAVNGIIEEIKGKLEKTEKTLKEKEKEIVKKSFEYSFDKIATSAGCLDVEALMIKLSDDEQDVLASNTNNGKLDSESEAVKAILEHKKKNFSYLFKKEEEVKNNINKKTAPQIKSEANLTFAERLKLISNAI